MKWNGMKWKKWKKCIHPSIHIGCISVISRRISFHSSSKFTHHSWLLDRFVVSSFVCPVHYSISTWNKIKIVGEILPFIKSIDRSNISSCIMHHHVGVGECNALVSIFYILFWWMIDVFQIIVTMVWCGCSMMVEHDVI